MIVTGHNIGLRASGLGRQISSLVILWNYILSLPAYNSTFKITLERIEESAELHPLPTLALFL